MKKRSYPEAAKTALRKDIGTLWRYVARTYDDNLRDRVYAYGGWDSFTRIDRLYVDSTDPCRYVVLVDAHNRDLPKYVRSAETLAKRHATAIVSLTWFATREEKCFENERRLEFLRFERDFMAACDNDDSSNDRSEESDDEYERNDNIYRAATGSRKKITNSMTNDASFLENDKKRRCVRETSKRTTSKDEPSTETGRSNENVFSRNATGELAEEDSAEERCDDDATADDMDAGCLVRAVLVSSESSRRNIARNVTLAQFFAEMILYLRTFAICDRVGLIRHKAFRLIRKDVVNRWCDAIVENANIAGDVRDNSD